MAVVNLGGIHWKFATNKYIRKEKEIKIMMQKIKKVFKTVLEVVLFTLGLDGEIRRQSVDDDICDFSGQGKDKYGH